MMTLDEIRNVEFNRGRGYRADEVDDFIDGCVEAVEAMARENEELNHKLKVLADKVNEYRNDEDAIRSALINAQRAGDTVLRDANAKAEQILKDAQEKAAHIREDAKSAIEAENEELARIRREVSAFKERLMNLYKEHLSLLNLLPVSEAAPAKAEELEPVVAPIEEDDADVIVVPDEQPELSVEPQTEDAVEELRPTSRFANIKFGSDYNIADDTDEEDGKDEDESEKKRLFGKKK